MAEENKEKIETPVEEKAEKEKKSNKKPKKEQIKKDVVFANAYSIRASPKFCFAVCKMIKNKTPEKAIEMLGDVSSKRKAVPMPNLEVGHKKGMAGGRYPVKLAEEMTKIVKQLSANAIFSGVENPVITIAKADRAAEPYRRDGKRGKRVHVHLEARDKTKLKGLKK